MQKNSVWQLQNVKKNINQQFFHFLKFICFAKILQHFSTQLHTVVVLKYKLHISKCLNTILNQFNGGDFKNEHHVSKFYCF